MVGGDIEELTQSLDKEDVALVEGGSSIDGEDGTEVGLELEGMRLRLLEDDEGETESGSSKSSESKYNGLWGIFAKSLHVAEFIIFFENYSSKLGKVEIEESWEGVDIELF